MDIDNFVIATKDIDNIVKNSVGIVKAINGNFAMVLFIGKNEIKRIEIENLKIIDIYKTGKSYKNKICNICHILKPTDDFEINQTDAKGIKTTRPSCRECRKSINGVKLSSAEKSEWIK